MSASVAEAHYAAEFEALKGALPGAWFLPWREAAMADFRAAGLPRGREEDWRHLDLRSLADSAFNAARSHDEPQAPATLDEAMRLHGTARHELVFVNGRYCPRLSCLGTLPAGVTVQNLGTALRAEAPPPGDYLQQAPAGLSSFALLNTAFLHDGVFIHLPSGAELQDPVHLLYVDAGAQQPAAVHPRKLVVLEPGAHALLVESYLSLDQHAYFCNSLTQAELGSGARLEHYQIQHHNPRAYHIGSLCVRQQEHSRLDSCSVLHGGAIARQELRVELAGSAAAAELHGLYVADDHGHADCLTHVEHCVPDTESSQVFRGLLRGHGHGAFGGRVVIREDAQRSAAHQSNANLLLSAHARADTRPMLEIYADDVQCSHGATVGKLDEDAVYYLRSRSLQRDAVTRILAAAFAHEVLERIRLAPLRQRLDAQIFGSAVE